MNSVPNTASPPPSNVFQLKESATSVTKVTDSVIADLVKAAKTTTIDYIKLEGCLKITAFVFKKLSTAVPTLADSLQSVELSGCKGINDDLFEQLTLFPKLQKVTVSNLSITVKGLTEFRNLAAKKTTFKSLDSISGSAAVASDVAEGKTPMNIDMSRSAFENNKIRIENFKLQTLALFEGSTSSAVDASASSTSTNSSDDNNKESADELHNMCAPSVSTRRYFQHVFANIAHEQLILSRTPEFYNFKANIDTKIKAVLERLKHIFIETTTDTLVREHAVTEFIEQLLDVVYIPYMRDIRLQLHYQALKDELKNDHLKIMRGLRRWPAVASLEIHFLNDFVIQTLPKLQVGWRMDSVHEHRKRVASYFTQFSKRVSCSLDSAINVICFAEHEKHFDEAGGDNDDDSTKNIVPPPSAVDEVDFSTHILLRSRAAATSSSSSSKQERLMFPISHAALGASSLLTILDAADSTEPLDFDCDAKSLGLLISFCETWARHGGKHPVKVTAPILASADDDDDDTANRNHNNRDFTPHNETKELLKRLSMNKLLPEWINDFIMLVKEQHGRRGYLDLIVAAEYASCTNLQDAIALDFAIEIAKPLLHEHSIYSAPEQGHKLVTDLFNPNIDPLHPHPKITKEVHPIYDNYKFLYRVLYLLFGKFFDDGGEKMRESRSVTVAGSDNSKQHYDSISHVEKSSSEGIRMRVLSSLYRVAPHLSQVCTAYMEEYYPADERRAFAISLLSEALSRPETHSRFVPPAFWSDLPRDEGQKFFINILRTKEASQSPEQVAECTNWVIEHNFERGGRYCHKLWDFVLCSVFRGTLLKSTNVRHAEWMKLAQCFFDPDVSPIPVDVLNHFFFFVDQSPPPENDDYDYNGRSWSREAFLFHQQRAPLFALFVGNCLVRAVVPRRDRRDHVDTRDFKQHYGDKSQDPNRHNIYYKPFKEMIRPSNFVLDNCPENEREFFDEKNEFELWNLIVTCAFAVRQQYNDSKSKVAKNAASASKSAEDELYEMVVESLDENHFTNPDSVASGYRDRCVEILDDEFERLIMSTLKKNTNTKKHKK